MQCLLTYNLTQFGSWTNPCPQLASYLSLFAPAVPSEMTFPVLPRLPLPESSSFQACCTRLPLQGANSSALSHDFICSSLRLLITSLFGDCVHCVLALRSASAASLTISLTMYTQQCQDPPGSQAWSCHLLEQFAELLWVSFFSSRRRDVINSSFSGNKSINVNSDGA